MSRSYEAAKRSAIQGKVYDFLPKEKRAAYYDRAIVLAWLSAGSSTPQNWVLKGGSAILWRDIAGRATQDGSICSPQS